MHCLPPAVAAGFADPAQAGFLAKLHGVTRDES